MNSLLRLVYVHLAKWSSFPRPLLKNDLIDLLGNQSLTNITQREDIIYLSEVTGGMYPGFPEFFYQYWDKEIGRGILEVAFHKKKIVNIRSQIFVTGLFSFIKVKNVYNKIIHEMSTKQFGKTTKKNKKISLWLKDKITIVVKFDTGPSYISSYLMDNNYCSTKYIL